MGKFHLTTKFTEDTENPETYFQNLRDLRVLRGENCILCFGCGYAALGPSW